MLCVKLKMLLHISLTSLCFVLAPIFQKRKPLAIILLHVKTWDYAAVLRVFFFSLKKTQVLHHFFLRSAGQHQKKGNLLCVIDPLLSCLPPLFVCPVWEQSSGSGGLRRVPAAHLPLGAARQVRPRSAQENHWGNSWTYTCMCGFFFSIILGSLFRRVQAQSVDMSQTINKLCFEIVRKYFCTFFYHKRW